MTKNGLKARVFTLTLAPTLIIGLFLSIFFTINRYNDLENQLVETGTNIIDPLAASCSQGLESRDIEKVLKFINYSHRRHSDIVRSIAIFDKNNQIFAMSNYHKDFKALQLKSIKNIPFNDVSTFHENNLIIHSPIFGYSAKTAHKVIGYVSLEIDLSSLHLQQYYEILTALIALIFGFLLSGVFAYRLMKDVTTPINHMVKIINKIKQGHLSIRIKGQLLGELDTLKNGINSMAISLSEYHNDMEKTIEQTTSDLRATLEQYEIQNVELDIAKRKAQEAARIKSEFLANMSHELRTPLNGVIGFTRQTLKTELTANQKDNLVTIEKSANNLLTIINDILDFSKLEAKKLILENTSLDFYDTVYEVIQLLSPSAHEKNIDLSLFISSAIPKKLSGDTLRIQQILTNIVGNAIKFTQSGFIEIIVELKSLKSSEVEIEFQINDSGIGISSQQKKHLFRAFSQADTSISRQYGGTGLGLVITKKLINHMKGDIFIDSKLNEGTNILFNLKLQNHNYKQSVVKMENTHKKALILCKNKTAKRSLIQLFNNNGVYDIDFRVEADKYEYIVAVFSPVDLSKDSNITQNFIEGIYSLSSNLTIALPSNQSVLKEILIKMKVGKIYSAPIDINKLRAELFYRKPSETYKKELENHSINRKPKLGISVLAVDDNEANLKLIQALLNEYCLSTEIVNNGKGALQKCQTKQFDIIFMDIQMPEMDGIETSQLIKNTSFNKLTPIIAVTAHAFLEEKQKYLQKGMSDYLPKPIDEHVLYNILVKWTQQDLLDINPTQIQSGINFQLALKSCANNKVLANDMIKMFKIELNDVEEKITNLIKVDDNDNMKTLIHKLHGSSVYCGAQKISKLCFTIENNLKKGKAIKDVEPELFELIDEINIII
ncbi:two-component sensor histidine kinase BarA [Paraphotobacterium marinum]|uniref:histidine kinase n=1 Tax=Paraphotobacterium marinum TaxID=1755811 RepID=A0A220VD14_9GAMM|nr:two-component sensor histidine kinase BarA [Paraphotobacterium marinum]ASK77863.1 two-component sensor histidine kinase BarA [Paraphotobacterium marinum]